MPAERSVGTDQPHLPYSALPDRPAVRLAKDTHVGVAPLLLLEVHEDPLPDWPQLASVAGGLDRASPNISRVSTREYGHRVGIFRLVDALTDRDFCPVVAIDVLSSERYPWLVGWLAERGTTWIAHGLSVNRPLGSHLSETQERSYIDETLTRLDTVGVGTCGWLGPEYGESERTPALLADAGLRYVCDWGADEQPIRMATPTGHLTAWPVLADLDDQTSLANRMMDPSAYGVQLVDAVRQLSVDGAVTARVLSFCVRPWLLGQPFRAHLWDRFLDAVTQTQGAFLSSPDALLDAFEQGLP